MKTDRLKHTYQFLLPLVLITLVFHGTAQRSPNTRWVLSKITSIPDRFKKGYEWDAKQDRFAGADSNYRVVARLDTFAIIRLIPALSDTTETTIPNTCDSGYLTYGQLAFLLINDIEAVPYGAVTHLQFDFFICGWFPDGLLAYVRNHPTKFEQQYRAYFGSRLRQQILREKRREQKKQFKTKQSG